MGDAENQQAGNLDDFLNQQNQLNQNQPDQNPQNQDQQEPLMAPYDPNEQHYPSRVLDNHLIADGGLPIFNGQQAEPALQAFSQVRNFPNNPQNAFANEELVRNHIAGTLALSEMTLFHAQMPEGDVPVYDRQEFDQRYNRFRNDPAVAEMSRRFVQDPQYRQSLLSDQNGVSADAFIKNTVSEFRNQTLALRQQNQANREEEEAENNPNPQVQEMDINQLNAMFVDPNMDLEGNGLDNEDNPILNQDINQNIQPNQNLQNQNPQFNQNIQQQNLQQQNIQQPGPQQNQPNPLPNQNQNQQILPDGNGAITYRQYMDMVAESIQGDAEAAVRDNVVANMLAAQMLIGDNPNRPVDWTMLRQVSERFSRQESFKEMLRDRPQDVRHAMMQNDAVALVGLLAQAETARNQRLEVYRRPQDRVQDDSALLQNALDSVKKKSGKSKSPAKAEKRNPLYQQMINKWAHLRRVTESGTQPTGFQVKELIDVTQRYINGGSNIAGGNQPDMRPAAFKEAMCVLKRYMPEEEFNAYCTNINLAQHVDVVEPSAFLPGRLTGYAVTGEELMNETRKALKKNQTPELYATVMAIHNLTKGRIGLIVNPADVEKEAQRLLKPGSGLNRTLQDPQSRARLDALAKDGSAKNLAQTLESHTLDHVAKTASGEFKLAQRMLTSGPLNRYFASKSLSMLLAAHRAASHSDAGTIINNRGFREKAEEIERDPKFQNLLDQYMNDLEFRNRINRELSNPNATAMELELQLERQQRNLRINRNPVREAQERHYDPRNMRPHRAMALDNGVGANGLPEFRGQNYSLSDPMVRQIHSFAGQPAANEQEALRIFAGALALSKSPVFRITENGRQEKVVNTDQFNQLFNNYRNDPAVQRMARDFAANPQYRERILHGNNERTPEGMITNISKELIALKRQEPQANRQQNQQVPQNQQINPNLQNQQVNPNRQVPQDQLIPVNQNGQQNRQNIRQRREEMALQNPYL